MKTMSVVPDLTGVNFSEETKKMSPQEICAAVIKNIIIEWAKQQKFHGLNEEDRRTYDKISDRLEDAAKDKKTEIDFEDSFFKFIYKAHKEVVMLPEIVLSRVEILIETAKEK